MLLLHIQETLGLILSLETSYPAWLTAKLLLTFTSTVIIGSESHRTHDHILLSDSSESLQTQSASYPNSSMLLFYQPLQTK
jgi:hypothetical protein